MFLTLKIGIDIEIYKFLVVPRVVQHMMTFLLYSIHLVRLLRDFSQGRWRNDKRIHGQLWNL